eukprot:9830216-Heterocapsa_arctica.AAC.1
MHILLAMAASSRWFIGIFDVSSAFLTGNDHERKLYFRPPREGLPSWRSRRASSAYARHHGF